MDDRLALLRGIVENLHEDLPRFVYADWLEERNQPHGEFIRLQCQLAQLDTADPAWVDLDQLVRRYFARYELLWTSPLKSILLPNSKPHRGFLPILPLPTPAFLHGLWFHSPLVLEIEWNLLLHELLAFDRLVKIISDERFSRVTRFHCVPSAAWVANNARAFNSVLYVLSQKNFPLLHDLDLNDCPLSITNLRLLREGHYLQRLTILRLRNCRLTDSGLEDILYSPDVQKLHTLQLAGNSLGDGTAAALLESEHLQQLRRVTLRGNVAISREMRDRLYQRFGPGIDRDF